jgi:hypothetical protein
VKQENLPALTVKQRRLLEALAERENGKDVWIDSCEAEFCEDLGWVESNPARGWVLTDLGKRLLS